MFNLSFFYFLNVGLQGLPGLVGFKVNIYYNTHNCVKYVFGLISFI